MFPPPLSRGHPAAGSAQSPPHGKRASFSFQSWTNESLALITPPKPIHSSLPSHPAPIKLSSRSWVLARTSVFIGEQRPNGNSQPFSWSELFGQRTVQVVINPVPKMLENPLPPEIQSSGGKPCCL